MPALLEELALFIEPFLERELVVELCEPIESGKEATVFRCRAHPRTGHSQLALEVYRPRTHRSFEHDAAYREGTAVLRRAGGNTRQARALRSGSSFGRELGNATWCGHEWEVLNRLHEAGLPVLAPVHATADAFLMELFTGAVDPRFHADAERLLVRDIGNVAHACARFADVPDAETIARDMWLRFERGET